MILKKMTTSATLAVGLAAAGFSVSAAGPALAGASTRAADAAMVASRSARHVSGQDRIFMNEASQINLAEVSLGRYMRVHAATTTARNLGATYAHDHTAAQARLRALASHLHVTVPTTPGAQLESVVARVEAGTGRNRDLAFAKASVGGHRTAIAIFRKEETAGSNPQVRDYAARYLPVLRMHLRFAEHAESMIRVTSAR